MYISAAACRRAAEYYKIAPNGCHISQYSVAPRTGLPQIHFRMNGVDYGTTAHRAVWVGANGQIPSSTHIGHTCGEKRCVRLDHLFIRVNAEWTAPPPDRPLKPCRNDHPVDRLRVNPKGRLRCRTCDAAYTKASRARRGTRK